MGISLLLFDFKSCSPRSLSPRLSPPRPWRTAPTAVPATERAKQTPKTHAAASRAVNPTTTVILLPRKVSWAPLRLKLLGQGLISLRTCASGYAWAASPQLDNDHKQLVECSGKGTCDRKSGECTCYDGFWGEGCRRSTCPNDCSGHGTCQSLKKWPVITSRMTPPKT